jgi:hypothetical protein
MPFTKNQLNPKQRKKLECAANIFIASAGFWNGDSWLLPLWGAGVVTHAQPKNKGLTIGESAAAAQLKKSGKAATKDHLFRVTETAKVILEMVQQNNMTTVADIENILLQRSVYMLVTSKENQLLKNTLKDLLPAQRDNWEELYKAAKIKYKLYT